MRAGSVIARVAIAAMLGVAGVAHADFQEDYARGLSAFDQGRNIDARRYLQMAVQQQPEPVDKVTLNGNVEQPYIPYHFLGLIEVKLGDCDAATKLWSGATHKRMISRLRGLRQQEQDAFGKCQPAVAKEDKTPANPPPDAIDANKPAVAETPAKPVNGKPGDTSTNDANRKKPPLVAAAPKGTPPPAPLVRAYEDFVAGRYADAARVDPEFFNDGRSRFHAYLLRAAARYNLAQLGGDRGLLDEARGDVRAAQALDASAPDPAVFSPRFRQFYGVAQ